MEGRLPLRFNWSGLGRIAPKDLVKARVLAHHALQWPTRAARANLAKVPDDSHSSLDWDPDLGALLSQPMKTNAGEVRVGLRLTGLGLLIVRNGAILDVLQLNGKPDQVAGIWIDSKLQVLGLRPASNVKLPYPLPDHPVATGGRYDLYMLERELGEISRWLGGSAEVLEYVKGKLAGIRPGAGPIHLWPHHFDIAMLVRLDEGAGENARSIGIGFSPGDEHYAQPYAYVSPSPRLNVEADLLPKLPHPGFWHTEGWFGAVAKSDDLIALQHRGEKLYEFFMSSIAVGRAQLAA